MIFWNNSTKVWFYKTKIIFLKHFGIISFAFIFVQEMNNSWKEMQKILKKKLSLNKLMKKKNIEISVLI